jgi:hypothetical protein
LKLLKKLSWNGVIFGEGHMNLKVRSIVRIAFLCASVAPLPFSQMALCSAESAQHMEKHTRKIEKKLTKYDPGTYLRIVFRDHSESLGIVDRLGATSFTFTDADSNATRSYQYADVAIVEKGETYIGEGSRRRHLPRLLVFGMAGAAAAGAIAAFTVTH